MLSYAFASETFRMEDKHKTKIQLNKTDSIRLSHSHQPGRQETVATELNQTSLSIDMGN